MLTIICRDCGRTTSKPITVKYKRRNGIAIYCPYCKNYQGLMGGGKRDTKRAK